MQNTVFIIGIPYFICVLYFSYSERSAKLKALMNENIGFKSSNLISIRDSRGVLQLSVAKENLLYIESADNYICIWYHKNDVLKKQLMRITMKEISEQLADSNIVRCHRSYMVNLDLVKVMRREKENLFLERVELPASLRYIGNHAFDDCDNLRNLRLRVITPRRKSGRSNRLFLHGSIQHLKIRR